MNILAVVFLFYHVCIVNSFFSLGNLKRAFDSDVNSDVFLNTFQLLKKYNYSVEEHIVITTNGYILKNYRIPGKGPPVLMVHGIGDSSDSWLVLGPKHSLACQLADFGFDVWLFNSRGNRYSKKHAKNISQKQYWDFSYEEIGSQDVPATIDHILSITRRSKLTYVGFSQGTTVFFVMCTMLPKYNALINHAILLAPVAGLKYIKLPIIELFSRNLDNLMLFAENRKVYEVFPYNENLNKFHAFACRVNSPIRLLCELEYFIDFGIKKITNLLPDRLPVISSHIPAGSSSKTFLHFLQGYAKKRFQRYDYGFDKNKETYSSSVPPEYDVSSISVPMTLVVSEVDWFGNIDDARILKNKLNTVNQYIVINESVQFTHLEFVYGSRVNSIINKPVINIIKNLNIS